MKDKTNEEPIAVVIVNPSDATKDVKMKLSTAKRMYAEGKLHWDLDNKRYCFPQPEIK